MAQTKLSQEKWQEDLRYLQETIHNDYSFLFVKTTKKIFDAEVEKLHESIPDLDEHEIIVGFSRIIALFEYGHSGISFNQEPYEFHYSPFNLYEYSDGIYVQGVHKKYPKALGAKVIAINKMPINDALQKVRPAVNDENDSYFKAFGINYLGILEVLHAQGITKKLEKSITLTLYKDGETFDQKFDSMSKGERVPRHYSHVFQDENWLEARQQDTVPLYLKNIDRIYFYEYLPKDKTVYVRHSQIQDDPQENIADFYARLYNFIEKNDVEKLILDVRLNGGGNNYKNRPIITGLIETKKINQKGKLYVIIGRRTFSACQNLVNELGTYTNATFVGEATAENVNFYGDAKKVSLPNSKIPVYLSFAWWQDKPVWEGADATIPSIPVALSFDEYRSNQDSVVETILSFSGADFRPDPMQYITDLYMAGKMDELAAEVPKMVEDPRYGFFDFESEISKTAFRLLIRNQIEPALGAYTFVTKLFPDSASAHKNLADAYLKKGDKTNAIESLKKVIEIDPTSTLGKSAQATLKSLKK